MAVRNHEFGYGEIFDNSPAATLIVSADPGPYTVIDANKAYLTLINTTRHSLIGKSIVEIFPNDDGQLGGQTQIIASIDQAIAAKRPHTIVNYKHNIYSPTTNKLEEHYLTATSTPVLGENGEVKYLIHTAAKTRFANKSKSIEALEAQRKQLYATFMQAPVGIAIFRGPDNIVELINPPLCEMYRRRMDEILGKPIFEVLTHAKGLGYEELLNNVRLTGIPYKSNGLPVPIKRGGKLETFYFNFVYEPFYEDDGSISGVVMVATEITDHINAQQQIHEAEERARLVVDAVGLGTFDLDLVNSEMSTSTIFANIFGFDAPVPRDQYVAVIHPDDVEKRLRAHNEAISSGRLFYEVRVVQRDKSIHWVRVEGKVFYDPLSKEAVRVLGILLDITERIKIKEALAEREQLLRSITSAAPTGLWMSDEKGSITYVNQTWIDWTRRSFEEQIGRGWMNAVVPEDREKVEAKFLNGLANKEPFEVEFRIEHADGHIHWCVASGKPQYRENSVFTGYIGACVDITEQKQLQQQKDDFIGIASHELKTPITSIKAYTQVLEKMLLMKGETKEAGMINKMDVQLNRLTSLITDLLDVTKINSGKLQFNDSEFDFNPLVKEIKEDLQRTTANHMIISHLAQTVTVLGDRERIGQVITNLVTNAIKYSPNANKIIIESTIKDEEVILSVQDFGIGISQKNLDKVFEQFYRASGDMLHTFPGLGLGLYISSEIIKRESGRIWVTSVEGKGSTFYFALPLLREEVIGIPVPANLNRTLIP